MNKIHPALVKPPASTKFDPAWRWTHVEKFSRAGALPRSVGAADPLVREAYDYHRRWIAASQENDVTALERLEADYPAISQAHTLFINVRNTARWTVEAFITGNATPAEVKAHYPIDERVVEVYEYLFYDVREYLVHPMFVMTQLVGPLTAGRAVGSTEQQWKLIAYLGGAKMLRCFMNAEPFDSKDASIVQAMFRKQVAHNALQAAMFHSTPNKWNAIDLQDLHIRYEDGQRASELLGSMATPMESHAQGVFAAVGCIMRGGNLVLPDNIPVTDAKFVEPRADELMQQQVQQYILEDTNGTHAPK